MVMNVSCILLVERVIYPRFILLSLLYVTKPPNIRLYKCIIYQSQRACCKTEALYIYDL